MRLIFKILNLKLISNLKFSKPKCFLSGSLKSPNIKALSSSTKYSEVTNTAPLYTVTPPYQKQSKEIIPVFLFNKADN